MRKAACLQTVLMGQGLYYLVTAIWPLVHISSFEAVSGKKTDHFTLRTTAMLITMIGSLLILGAGRKPSVKDTAALGIGSAVTLASADIVHAPRLRPVYWIEAMVEIGLAVSIIWSGWFAERKELYRCEARGPSIWA